MKDTSDDYDLSSLRVRALFVSDVHLGTRTSQAGRLLDLLRCCEVGGAHLPAGSVSAGEARAKRYSGVTAVRPSSSIARHQCVEPVG